MNTKTAKNNRRKGHNLERKIANQLKEIGYEATTSRYSSREKDDKGIDIVIDAPLAIQCKNQINFPNPHPILKAIKSNDYKILIVNQKSKGITATLPLNDLLELLEMLRSNEIL